MGKTTLTQDPYNVIITGVGGQGNVLASKILGNMLVNKGLKVTIGETFGASQRGGSVMSHLRISGTSVWSPQIPNGQAHIIIALEPIEALRTLSTYGNPDTRVIVNDRPIHPVGVICGDQEYPEPEKIRNWLERLNRYHWILPATDEAVKLGLPILGNIILIGALAGTGVLPVGREDFAGAISAIMPAARAAINLQAFDIGRKMIESTG
jgi:indolepyruvate ferredoxin oxidoreductase, beta subunit